MKKLTPFNLQKRGVQKMNKKIEKIVRVREGYNSPPELITPKPKEKSGYNPPRDPRPDKPYIPPPPPPKKKE